MTEISRTYPKRFTLAWGASRFISGFGILWVFGCLGVSSLAQRADYLTLFNRMARRDFLRLARDLWTVPDLAALSRAEATV